MNKRFDTLEYTRGAEAVGIKREHAEFQARALSDLIFDTLATKHDLKELKDEIIIKIGAMMIICSGIIISILGFIIKH